MAKPKGSEAWDLAGFTDSQSRLGRRIPTGELFTFKDIRLDKGQQNLITDYQDIGRVTRPQRDLLDGFIQLAESPPPAILNYARRWGLLLLNDQGRPCSKSHPRVPGPDGKMQPRSEPLEA